MFAEQPLARAGAASFETGRPSSGRGSTTCPTSCYFNHSIHVNEGRRLRDLPRPRRPDAADVAGGSRCRWSGASTATAIRSATSARATPCSRSAIEPPADQLELGRRLVAEYQIQKLTELLDVPSMKPDRRDARP